MKFFTFKRLRGIDLAAALTLGSVLFSAGASAAPGDAANTPARSVWLDTVAETEKGSFVMGNPDAPTKVVEYASYTCGHCATFEANDAPRLETEKVASGRFSFEIRSLVRDPIDLTMAMLARCGGKEKFFGNHKFLMANQKTIFDRADSISQATIAKLNTSDFSGFITDAYGEMKLTDLMQQRGITDEQAKICLSDSAALGNLFATTQAASKTYSVNSTPSFLVDDKLAVDVHDYDSLKPMLTALK